METEGTIMYGSFDFRRRKQAKVTSYPSCLGGRISGQFAVPRLSPVSAVSVVETLQVEAPIRTKGMP